MVANLILLIFQFFYILLLARVVISWIRPNPTNPIVQFIYNATEPFLAPIRQLLPAAGGLDFSPIILFLLLRVLQQIVFGFI